MNCVDTFLLHKLYLKHYLCDYLRILLKLEDYICIQTLEMFEKERFKYTYFQQKTVHSIREKVVAKTVLYKKYFLALPQTFVSL